MGRSGGHRRAGTPAPNPIAAAVSAWAEALPSALLEQAGPGLTRDQLCCALVDAAPKRWVVYEPMALLPAGAFASGPWEALLRQLGERLEGKKETETLWASILEEITRSTGGPPLSHLAANEGIPARVAAASGDAERPLLSASDVGSVGAVDGGSGEGAPSMAGPGENILRSPVGLRMLYGDFGPSTSRDPSSAGTAITTSDLKDAFWVSTKQNGIRQTWAPRWTMFSRGNVKEKARLLAFHDGGSTPPASLGHRSRPRADLRTRWAVDLYAGIGYFAFSYAKLGFRVLCWELNPWSVEGLRRGAEANGWPVRVVRGDDLALSAAELAATMAAAEYRIIVFQEDNRLAGRRIEELRTALSSPSSPAMDVMHVNCGLLPSSVASWELAWSILGVGMGEGWLHLHENIGIADVDKRRREIQRALDDLAARNTATGSRRTAMVEHVERVKTFAPGVWHCVFDVYSTHSRLETQCEDARS